MPPREHYTRVSQIFNGTTSTLSISNERAGLQSFGVEEECAGDKQESKIEHENFWPRACREKRISYRNAHTRFFLRRESSLAISLMTPTSLIVVADRGTFKAYRVDETPTRGPSLHLIQAFNITDAHGKMIDKVTDLAGRYGVADGAGIHHGASTADSKLETETDRRIYKQLADQIVKIIERRGKEGWSFAAPAEIHSAIVDLLPGNVRDRIVEHVKSDLVKTEPTKLPEHFRSLRPM